MKKRKLITLLLFSTMLFTSCGQKNTSEETENTEFREEAVTESTTEQTSAQAETAVDAGNTDHFEYPLEEQSNVTVYLDQVQDKNIIVDGEKEIPFQIGNYAPEVTGAYKMDVNGDQKDEYVITVCEGRGTGVYRMGLAVVEEGNEQPIGYLSSEEIAKNINGRISYRYNSEFQTLYVYTGEGKNEEYAGDVSLKTAEEEYGSGFESAGFGEIIYIEYKEREFWIRGDLGLFFKDFPAPEFEPTVSFAAPITFSEGCECTIGKIGVKIIDDLSINFPHPEACSEVLSQFSADITHDGQEDLILLTVPEGATLQEVMDGRIAFGQFYVSAKQNYLAEEAEGDFSDLYYIIKKEFSPTHAENGQIFVTTIEGKDYLIETNFWSGNDTFTYQYDVYFEDYDAKYEMESAKIEMSESSSKEDISEFFSDLNKWVNDSTYVVYVADIDYEPNLFYSTEDHKISPVEYLAEKEKQWLEALESL